MWRFWGIKKSLNPRPAECNLYFRARHELAFHFPPPGYRVEIDPGPRGRNFAVAPCPVRLETSQGLKNREPWSGDRNPPRISSMTSQATALPRLV